MKLFIANLTRQTHNFMYRLPGQNGVRSQVIPIGGQIPISGDLSQQDVDYIIEYNAKYGMVDFKDIDRTKPFVGLCYSVGKAVPSAKMIIGMTHNLEVLTERGHENRKMAAITANDALEKQLQQNNVAELAQLEVEITEEVKTGRTNTADPLAEAFRVSRRDQGDEGGKGKKSGSKKNRAMNG